MTYSVSILLRARQDVQQIFDWLAARSEQGAQSWFESFVERRKWPMGRRISRGSRHDEYSCLD